MGLNRSCSITPHSLNLTLPHPYLSNTSAMPRSVSSLNSTTYASSTPADTPSIGMRITHASHLSTTSLSTLSSLKPQILSISRIRILLAPYMSPFVVPMHRVETWEVGDFFFSIYVLERLTYLLFITAPAPNTPNTFWVGHFQFLDKNNRPSRQLDPPLCLERSTRARYDNNSRHMFAASREFTGGFSNSQVALAFATDVSHIHYQGVGGQLL